MRRVDGRDSSVGGVLRELSAEVSLLNRADGSASWSQDRTSILAAVYGPREVPARKEIQGKCVIEVVVRPRSGVPGDRERELEASLSGVLEQLVMTALHPRSLLSVIVQLLEEDGSVMAACLNAVMLALLDAGVPTRGIVGACTVGVWPAAASEGTQAEAMDVEGEAEGTKAEEGVHFLVDPTAVEEKDCVSVHTGVYLISREGDVQASLMQHHMGSGFTAGRVLRGWQICGTACVQIVDFMRTLTQQRIQATASSSAATPKSRSRQSKGSKKKRR